MKDFGENDLDLVSIDPNSWHNIPKPLIKSIETLIKSCTAQSFQIKNLRKDLKVLNSSHLQQSLTLDSVQKLIDSKIQSISDNLQTNLICITNNLKNSFEDLSKDYNESKLKLQNLQKTYINESAYLKENLQNNKEAVKIEIFSKHIKPEFEKIKLEQIDVNKNINALEKQVKYVGYKSEKNYDDILLKLENQQIQIKKVENSVNSVLIQFDNIANEKLENLQSKVKNYEKHIEESYKNFKSIFKDLCEREENFKKAFDEKIELIEEQAKNFKHSSDSLLKSNENLAEKVWKLEEAFKFESEKLKIETEKFILDCYQKAKEKLVHSYQEDIRIVKQKLDWLPQELESVRDLAPLEARLYTLESRLKREETNRIVQKIEILKDVEDKIYTEVSRERSITPTLVHENKTPKHKIQMQGFKSIIRKKNKTPEYIHTSLNPSIGKCLY